MRVIVCGDRHWTDIIPIRKAIESLECESVIIHGNATGVDQLAHQVAKVLGWWSWSCPAEWNRKGYAAGPARNQRMLEEGRPDLVLAFPSVGSRGTWDMVRRAEKAGVPVRVVRLEPELLKPLGWSESAGQ